MNNDYDFIKDTFDNDGLRAPDSLSEDRIRNILPDQAAELNAFDAAAGTQDNTGQISDTADKSPGEQTNGPADETLRRKKRFRLFRNTAAVAACLILAVLLVPNTVGRIGGSGSSMNSGDPAAGAAAEELRVFDNYSEIEKLVKELREDSGFGWGKSSSDVMMIQEEAEEAAPDSARASAELAASDGASANEAAGTDSHSETYLQVNGVDEADIVKTDGKYIYYVNRNSEVVILSAENGETKKVASIGNGSVENYIHDIYLDGSILVTIGVIYEDEKSYSSVVSYDISDPSEPEVINTFKQSGDIISSRRNGDYVYLVTCEYIYDDGRIVPMASGENGYAELPAGSICCVPDPKTPSYVVLSAVNITNGDSDSRKEKLDKDTSGKTGARTDCRSIAIFGASENIYCNQENLYTTVSEYDYENDSVYSRIIRASLNGTKIQFEASGKVRGTVYDQFAMDEKDGFFRVATTSTRDGIQVNNLFVLDRDLKDVGSITGFARNESIRAVRYIGEKAYVITFEQVDPLFVIDLKDPANPSIEGEVQIEGFSSLLIPTAENRLLGIGYLTADNGYGGVYTDGLKLALFDISDPSVPKVLDSKEFPNMSSPAQYTHLALNVNSDKGYFAIPYGIQSPEAYENGNDAFTSGVLVFGAGDQIEVYDEHVLANEDLPRSVYIGDWIYALNRKGSTYSFMFPS